MQDVAAVLAAEYPKGVDVVYEGVGGALRAAIMQHLAPNARVLQVRPSPYFLGHTVSLFASITSAVYCEAVQVLGRLCCRAQPLLQCWVVACYDNPVCFAVAAAGWLHS